MGQTILGHQEQKVITGDYTGTWSVWGKDSDYIYIISTESTTKTLGLAGALGYNNGVTLLDTLCDTVFTNRTSYPFSVAQNLKLEQVLAVKSDSLTNQETRVRCEPPGVVVPYTWLTYENSQDTTVTNRSKAYALTTEKTVDCGRTMIYYNKWSNTTSSVGYFSGYWLNSDYFTLIMSKRYGEKMRSFDKVRWKQRRQYGSLHLTDS